jgi:hypothetical protein
MRGIGLRALRAIVVLVAGAVTWALVVPQHSPDGSRLAGLVIAHSAVPGIPRQAAVAKSLPPTASTFAVTKRAGKRDPNHTGLFGREWYVSSNGPPEAGVVLQLLPDAADARAAYGDVAAQLDTAPSLPGETAGAAVAFDVTGVAVARGAAFSLTDATASTHPVVGYAYKTVLRVGRAVVSELAVTTDTTMAPAPMVSDARANGALLAAKEPGFDLERTHVPVVATVVAAACTVVVAVGATFGPEWAMALVRRRRARKAQREERRAREQYLARGRRAVKRQRAPSWSTPRKR